MTSGTLDLEVLACCEKRDSGVRSELRCAVEADLPPRGLPRQAADQLCHALGGDLAHACFQPAYRLLGHLGGQQRDAESLEPHFISIFSLPSCS